MWKFQKKKLCFGQKIPHMMWARFCFTGVIRARSSLRETPSTKKGNLPRRKRGRGRNSFLVPRSRWPQGTAWGEAKKSATRTGVSEKICKPQLVTFFSLSFQYTSTDPHIEIKLTFLRVSWRIPFFDLALLKRVFAKKSFCHVVSLDEKKQFLLQFLVPSLKKYEKMRASSWWWLQLNFNFVPKRKGASFSPGDNTRWCGGLTGAGCRSVGNVPGGTYSRRPFRHYNPHINVKLRLRRIVLLVHPPPNSRWTRENEAFSFWGKN